MTIKLKNAGTGQSGTISMIVRESYKEQARILKMDAAIHPNYAGFESAEKVQARLQSGDHALLAFYDDIAVGTVSYQESPEKPGAGYIKRFAILKAYRGRGWGLELMNRAEQGLWDLGISRAEISIVAGFEALRLYYESQGYRVFDRRSIPSLPFEIAYMAKSLTGPAIEGDE